MPVAGSGPGGSRQTFRPPWVKDGPPPIPMPTTPWVKNVRAPGPTTDTKDAAGVVTKALRKVSDAGKPQEGSSTAPVKKKSSITIIPTVAPANENGSATKVSEAKATPAARKVSEPAPKPPVEPTRKVSEPASKPPTDTGRKISESSKPTEKTIPVQRANSNRPKPLQRSETSEKYEGLKSAPAATSAPPPPPAPPAPPMMPPPPPPPPSSLNLLPDKAEVTEVQKQKLEALRSRPKRRPDWGNMMKEIETGRKLCHVNCNDRSAPLIPSTKTKGQFVYESECPNLHNQLLKQIASGVKLKCVKTNDRSKPFIEGLRKFRRQMTIEEQIQKSTSIASMGIAEVEPDPLDEVDDIDKVRDDLQSTKQLLAMELKNKEAMERENKKLLARLLNMEVELEKEKNRVNKDAPEDRKEMTKEINNLKTEADQAKRTAEEMETKFHDTAAKLELTKLDLDEAVQKAQRLEKQLKVAQAANLANASSPLAKQPSSKKIANQNRIGDVPINRNAAEEEESEEEEDETETETETESEAEGEDAAAAAERRQIRELKLLASKLRSFKEKRELAKKERKALKEQTVKQQKALRDEKKKYKLLQKEVDKMSKLMNEEAEDDEEEEEEEEEEDDDEEEEESESESESESEESDGDLPETAPPDKKKANFQNRVKRYENLVSALKKGNYLLKANVERYRDELNKQKEMSISLQEDLNSVLAELG